MKNVKLILLLGLFIMMSSYLSAQDLLYLRGVKQPLKVKVIEVGIDEVKYKNWPVTEESIVNVIEKSALSRVLLQNGDEYTFKEDPNLIEGMSFDEQKKMALKFSMFSPLNDNLEFWFEKYISKGRSIEAAISFIGAGMEIDDYYYMPINPAGTGLRFGYKFINTPDFYMRGMKRAHVLKGGYIKPEVLLSVYGADDYTYNNVTFNYEKTGRETIFGGALVINVGKQWIFSNAICLDLSIGLGYGFGNADNVEYAEADYYNFIGGVDEMPLAFTSSFKIGGLLGAPKKTTE